MTESEKRRDAVMRYLNRPRECDRLIRRKQERIRDLRSSLTLQSPAITDMPRNPSPPASRMEETLVKIFSLEEEIREDTFPDVSCGKAKTDKSARKISPGVSLVRLIFSKSTGICFVFNSILLSMFESSLRHFSSYHFNFCCQQLYFSDENYNVR